MKLFKNKSEELKHEKESFLTIGKLIEYLQQFDNDSLIYMRETNTNTWQVVPKSSYILRPIPEERKQYRKQLNNFFRGSLNKDQKIQRELKEIFKYVLDKKGICLIY